MCRRFSSFSIFLCTFFFIWVFCFYLPHKYTDIILGATIARDWEDAGPHCYFTVDLNEARAKEIVATCGLISITLFFTVLKGKHPKTSSSEIDKDNICKMKDIM